MIRIEVKRSGNFRENLARIMRERIEPRVSRALLAAGESLLAASQQLVPRDTEALAESGVVFEKPGTDFGSVVVVGYGMNPSFVKLEYSQTESKMVLRRPSEYAVYVHEDVSRSYRVGQSNYLQGAISVSELSVTIREAVRK